MIAPPMRRIGAAFIRYILLIRVLPSAYANTSFTSTQRPSADDRSAAAITA